MSIDISGGSVGLTTTRAAFIEQAQQAYAPNQIAIRTDRSIEAQLISGITSRLQSAGKLGKAGFPKLIAALHENRRLW